MKISEESLDDIRLKFGGLPIDLPLADFFLLEPSFIAKRKGVDGSGGGGLARAYSFLDLGLTISCKSGFDYLHNFITEQKLCYCEQIKLFVLCLVNPGCK